MLKPAQTGIVWVSLSSLKLMSSACSEGVREKGRFSCYPVFDEFREQNRDRTRVWQSLLAFQSHAGWVQGDGARAR